MLKIPCKLQASLCNALFLQILNLLSCLGLLSAGIGGVCHNSGGDVLGVNTGCQVKGMEASVPFHLIVLKQWL